MKHGFNAIPDSPRIFMLGCALVGQGMMVV